jgi:hypothetical protein
VFRPAENKRKGSDRGGETQIGRSVGVAPVHYRAGEEPAPGALGVLVAQSDSHQLRASAGRWPERDLLIGQAVTDQGDRRGPDRHHLIQRSHGVSRADLARILLVVGEVFLGQQPVLVSQEAVCLHLCRVELDLNLHVLGHGEEGAAELPHEDFMGFAEVVDVGVVTVPLVGHLLHLGVLEVPGSKAEDGEEGPFLAASLHQADHLRVGAHAHVEVPIGGQDQAVVPLLQIILSRHIVRELQSRSAGGRATRLEPVDCLQDRGLIGAGRGREHQPGRTGVNHDGHAVLGTQLLHQSPKCLLHQRELVLGLHGARHINQEDQIAGREIAGRNPLRLETDPDQPMFGCPGARPYFSRNRERMAAGAVGVCVREIVDQLFQPDRVGRRQCALAQKAADVAVGSRIHVDGEGREWVGRRGEEAILLDARVGLGVAGLTLNSPRLDQLAIGVAFASTHPGSPRHAGLRVRRRRSITTEGFIRGHDLAHLERTRFQPEIVSGGPALPHCDGRLDRPITDGGGADRHAAFGNGRKGVGSGGVGQRVQRRSHDEDLRLNDG